MSNHDIYKFDLKEMYQLYKNKVERKGRTSEELNEAICWLTGYTNKQLIEKMDQPVDLETFFKEAPFPNPNRQLITGTICGVKIVEIQEPIMKEIRYLDKLVDELAKGKAMEKILRTDKS